MVLPKLPDVIADFVYRVRVSFDRDDDYAEDCQTGEFVPIVNRVRPDLDPANIQPTCDMNGAVIIRIDTQIGIDYASCFPGQVGFLAWGPDEATDPCATDDPSDALTAASFTVYDIDLHADTEHFKGFGCDDRMAVVYSILPPGWTPGEAQVLFAWPGPGNVVVKNLPRTSGANLVYQWDGTFDPPGGQPTALWPGEYVMSLRVVPEEGVNPFTFYRMARSTSMTVYVVDVDLDVDSDNNGGVPDEGEDEIEMDSPGMVVGIGGAARPGIIQRVLPWELQTGQLYLKRVSGGALLKIYRQGTGQLLYSTDKAQSADLWGLVREGPVWLDIAAPVDPEQEPGEVVLEVEYRNGGFSCTDRVKVTAFTIDLITPAGDPIYVPVHSGDGQNEFTFSAATPGVLTINLKAAVSPSGITTWVKDMVRFTVEAIGNSQLTWDPSNPGGKPTVAGDHLLATVRFTGLPAYNSDFGSKKAAVFFDNSKIEETSYEVFYSKNAPNHPGTGSGVTPNWYFYWHEALGPLTGIAYGGGSISMAGEVKGMTQWSYTVPPDKITRYIYDAASDRIQWVNPNFGPWTGIDAFYNVYLHESKHVWQIATYDTELTVAPNTPWQYGWSWNQGLPNHNHETLGPDGVPGAFNVDDDSDGTVDNLVVTRRGELGYGGDDIRKCDPGWDTWPLSQGVMPPQPWAQNSPNEHKAYEAMTNPENAQAAKDWGDPGKQHATLNKHDD